MSRPDPGAPRRPARHARDRLQATLGASGGLLLQAGGEEPFEYRGADGAVPVAPDSQDFTTGPGRPAGQGPALRWRLGLRVAVLLAVLAVAAAALFWWQTATGAPDIQPLGGVSPGTAAGEDSGQAGDAEGPGGAAPGETSPGTVVVHIAGAVAAPGVVRLPAGSRVHEAVAAAGGGTPDADLNRLNLALVVEDAQKIHVPRFGEETPSGTGTPAVNDPAGAAPGPGGAKININTAEAAELDALPKVGPVLAQRIVDWRKEHGAFKSIEELDAVDGVGPKMLETLLPLVTV